MSIFTVNYVYDSALNEQRLAVRPQHRDWLNQLVDQSVCLAAGAFQDRDGGLLIFRGEDQASVEKLLQDDPYKVAGVISSTTVENWPAVIGAFKDYVTGN